MAQSLVKLTLESNQYERGIRQAQKTWNDFTRGLGISIGKFTAVGAAIGAVSGALKVAKDAFFKNEQQLDEWNRTVEASKSVYNGFLNALNNGDISGFLTSINDITEAARAAYDALDELSTFNAFNQIQTQKARTGFTEAMAGFRMGEGSKENVQQAAKAYQEELRTRQKKEQEAYLQAIRKVAAERGVSWGGLEQALTGKYGDYETLKNTMPSGKQIKFLPSGQFGGSIAVEVPMAVTIQEKMGEALRSLNDTEELEKLQALGAQAYRTGEEIAQIDKQMARVLKGRTAGTSGGGGGRGGSGVGDNSRYFSDFSKFISKSVVGADALKGSDIKDSLSVWAMMSDETKKSMLGLAEATEDLGDAQARIGEQKVAEEIANRTKLIEQQNKAMNMAAQSASNFGNALASLDNPAAQAAGTVISAIANIALGFGQAVAQAGTMGPWAWLAYVAAGTAALATTISTVHSLTGYAEGGIVKGNSYSGDNVGGLVDGSQLVGLNAGELVLTKAQQGSLAQTLQGNEGRTIRVVGKLSGKDLFICAENWSKSAGHGEFVTW